MNKVADVCLILEGTYPYVQGGVSSWVHQIVTELTDVTFAIVFMGSTKESATTPKYKIPSNVLSVTEVFLFEPLPERERRPSRTPAAVKSTIYSTIERFYLAENEESREEHFWSAIDAIAQSEITFGDLATDRQIWDLLLKVYDRFCPNESFTDFFWTARFVHIPFWITLKTVAGFPPAKLYHSVSTGYAGLAGAVASRREKVPYLITEHGIYTKERIAEISQATWIHDPPPRHLDLSGGLGKIKQIWINFFLFLGKVSYDRATQLISLYEGITQLQTEFGADPEKIRVVPNGIDPVKFDDAFHRRAERLREPSTKRTIGFIGRVVPIKDVKTLIRAAKLVSAKYSDATFDIIGPTDEDPSYFADCEEMVRLLGLEDIIRFRGSMNIREVLHELDVVLLTSISEGLPLIILEAFSAGVPVVSTDVGACRELIFGRTMEDKAIGKAGLLTKICSPEETADALLILLQNQQALLTMGASGRERVERYYRQSEIMNIYDETYRNLAQPQSAPNQLVEV